MTRAFVFPGQGSQSLGMLKALSEAHSEVETTFGVVSDALGYDVWALTQEGPEEKLNQTEYTQVVMLTADVAVYSVLQSLNIDAEISAGHSLGEYAALVAADAMTLADAAKLVQTRGQLMQKHVPLGEGAMAAIVGLADDVVETLCKSASNETGLSVSPANFNAIGQVVIAGHTQAVESAIKKAEEAEARLARMIPVSVPCHCELLKAAAVEFIAALDATPMQAPSRKVINNVNLGVYTSPDEIRTTLASQLYSPVRWVETIQKMKSAGVSEIIECGPGAVLSGLAKRIDKSIVSKQFKDYLS